MVLLSLRTPGKCRFLRTCEPQGRTGEDRLGKVVDISEQAIAVQLFSRIQGISIDGSGIEYLEKPLTFRVGDGIVGRIFNGLGEPIDGYPPIISSDLRDINGSPINPSARVYPRDFIQTGISAIDGMNTLIRGQKLPIFSATVFRTTDSQRRLCARRRS